MMAGFCISAAIFMALFHYGALMGLELGAGFLCWHAAELRTEKE